MCRSCNRRRRLVLVLFCWQVLFVAFSILREVSIPAHYCPLLIITFCVNGVLFASLLWFPRCLLAFVTLCCFISFVGLFLSIDSCRLFVCFRRQSQSENDDILDYCSCSGWLFDHSRSASSVLVVLIPDLFSVFSESLLGILPFCFLLLLDTYIFIASFDWICCCC